MTATVETFEVQDESPLFADAENDTPPLMCARNGCTNAITKPARGRTPKYCDEHKDSRNSPTPSRSKASGKSWPRAGEIETHLSDTIRTIGTLTGRFYNEFDGEHLKEHGPKVIHELVELAKDDKNLQKWLTWLAAPGKYGPLVSATGGLVVPIFMNHQIMAATRRAEREAHMNTEGV